MGEGSADQHSMGIHAGIVCVGLDAGLVAVLLRYYFATERFRSIQFIRFTKHNVPSNRCIVYAQLTDGSQATGIIANSSWSFLEIPLAKWCKYYAWMSCSTKRQHVFESVDMNIVCQ